MLLPADNVAWEAPRIAPHLLRMGAEATLLELTTGGCNVLVNMPLVQCTSRGAAPPPFRDFVAENNSFALPESTSLAMLLLK